MVNATLKFYAPCCIIKQKRSETMEVKYYTVIRIEGEYAYIREDGTAEELFIAMALLPLGADIGTRLRYENFEFSIMQ